MGQHRPLGTGLGATRVHNLRQVATPVLRRWQGVLACTQRLEVGHALRTVRRVLRRYPDKRRHARLHLRRLTRGRTQRRVGYQGTCTRVAQDIGDLVALQHEVDRHQHRPHAGQSKTHRDKAMRIARQHGNAVSRAYPGCEQPRSQPIDAGTQRRISPLGLTANDRGFVGNARRCSAQHICNRLTPDRRMHNKPFKIQRRLPPSHVGAPRFPDQAFLAHAEHQPLAATCLPGKMPQPPAAEPAPPWYSAQPLHAWDALWLGNFLPLALAVSAT